MPAATKQPKKRGRPSAYTDALAITICEKIALGQSLRKICEGESMPTQSMIYRWLADDRHAKFREQYARARELQADTLADEILDIANTPQTGTKSVSKATGIEITEGDMIEHRRLQVDARKWYASKLAPKKYGDRQQVDMKVEDITPISDRMKKARERAKGK